MNTKLFPSAVAAALLLSPFVANSASIPVGTALKSGVNAGVFAFGHTDFSFSTLIPGTPIQIFETSESELNLEGDTFENSSFKARANLASGDAGLAFSGGDVPETTYDYTIYASIFDTLDFSFADGADGLIEFDLRLDGSLTKNLDLIGNVYTQVEVWEYEKGATPFVVNEFGLISAAPASNQLMLERLELVLSEDFDGPANAGADPDHYVYLTYADISDLPSGSVIPVDLSRPLSFTAREDKSYAVSVSLVSLLILTLAGTELDFFNSAGIEITGVTGPTGAPGLFISASALLPGSANLGATAAVPLPAPLLLLPTGLALLVATGRRRRRMA
ncbi:MAG: hypothetical protein ACE37J_15025 [Pikeienuella sp.]|uniref:hypothetical protein n=1 Tax=Pikeienuella sp. TaxID=2831957 RepID=UPI00391B2DE0